MADVQHSTARGRASDTFAANIWTVTSSLRWGVVPSTAASVGYKTSSSRPASPSIDPSVSRICTPLTVVQASILHPFCTIAIMQFTSLVALAALISSAFAVTVSYDQTYDNRSGSLTTVACSDGPNGLITKGFSTFGSLPHFPNIGGAAAVGGWNSAQCGSCWQLTYNGKSINVLAVDHTDSGFNIALEAMNTLTNNQAVFLGRVDATARQVAASNCGL